jgi:hypothetical protein
MRSYARDSLIHRLSQSSKRVPAYLFLLLVTSLISITEVEAADPRSTAGGNESGFADVSFGFKTGISLSQHAGTEERDPEYGVSSSWRTGYIFSLFAYWPVTERFGLQQELVYVQKGSYQDITVDILDIPTVLDVTYEMDYIEIPVLLKFVIYEKSGSAVYSLAGTALSLKVRDRYILTGEIDDGEQIVPLRADDDMSEVDMFDYSFIYGTGLSFSLFGKKLLVEHRFTIGWNTLAMPTYTYVPLGDERLLIDNAPVPLKNQNHLIMLGISF